MFSRLLTTALLTGFLVAPALPVPVWKPAPGPLLTRWGKAVRPEQPLPEYPRPQMTRQRWQNLNGLWEYAVTNKDDKAPRRAQGVILVPFAYESALSGVGQRLQADQRLWYRRHFKIPADWAGQRVKLHFGAVDWDTQVYVNGQKVGQHRGGYDPFEFDVTRALTPNAENELTVAVHDPSDTGQQPRGKQVAQPKGIWYTPVSGIWQTVWLEPVPQQSLQSLHLVPRIEDGSVSVTPEIAGNPKGLALEAEAAGQKASGPAGEPLRLSVPNPRLWSPDNPHLYDLKVRLVKDGQPVDEVGSYFGLRKVELGKDAAGRNRILLNGQPIFQFGLLDQGWWPDGLYTAPSDEALRYDLEMTKKLGFNMARKHVKTEPARWYTHCDRLGILVWQDMPSGGPEARWDPNGKFDGTELARGPAVRQIYETEWAAIIKSLRNHPSILMWVPFNEGWGQFDTERITRWTQSLDPTRLVNPASGGNDFPVGHVKDLHRYPGPAAPKPDGERAIVLGEFGGLGLPVAGHIWQNRDNWGYRTYHTAEELAKQYFELVDKLAKLIPETGLSAAIYTQTTDVEGEVNGMMTYDREVVKIDPARAAEAAAQLYAGGNR